MVGFLVDDGGKIIGLSGSLWLLPIFLRWELSLRVYFYTLYLSMSYDFVLGADIDKVVWAHQVEVLLRLSYGLVLRAGVLDDAGFAEQSLSCCITGVALP